MSCNSIRWNKIRVWVKIGILLFIFAMNFCFVSHAMTKTTQPKYYDLEFTDIKGKKRSVRKFKTKSVVLMFGRSGCSYSRSMLSSANRIKEQGLKTTIVFFGVDSYDSGLYSLSKLYKKIIFVPASRSNNQTMWSMLHCCGSNKYRIMLPATFILNKYGFMQYYTTGEDYGLYSTLKRGKLKNKIKISKKNCDVFLAGKPDNINTVAYKKGKPRKPKLTVYLYGPNGYGELVKGRDYTVKYKNNRKAGKAKAIIKGKGGFKGKVTYTFIIKK